MPQFHVHIHGEDLEAALVRLNGARVPTIADLPASFGEGESPTKGLRLDGLVAVLEAETPAAAEERVRGHLPDGAYSLSAESEVLGF